MNAKEFIKSKLKAIQKDFSEISFKYAFNDTSSMHMVEVLPEEIFEKSKKYADLESDLIFEFDNNFYPESILFISNNSLVKIDNVEFELKPKLENGYLLSDLLKGELSKTEIARCLLVNDQYKKDSRHFILERKAESKKSAPQFSGFSEDIEELCGNNNLALAA